MKLYGYWRSGTSYRVRLALALKGVEVDHIPVNLKEAEHQSTGFQDINPSAALPTLMLDDGTRISQSFSVIEYLEERFPEPTLLPVGAKSRARVRQLAGIIACDIHPLQNLRVQKYLRDNLNQPAVEIDAWIRRWVGDGLRAFEAHLKEDATRGDFCFGGKPGYTECFLLPQLYSARRFKVSLDAFPACLGVEAATLALPQIVQATPEAQQDAVP